MDDDEEFERLLEELTRLCNEETARRAQEMWDHRDEVQPVELGPEHVVLLGFEEQVDAVWSVTHRPEVLRRPLRLTTKQLLAPPSGADLYPTLREARYRRVGEFTYQREH